MTEPVDPHDHPPPLSSEASSLGTGQPALQVVGLDDLKGALKSVFDEALAQFKAEQPTGSSTISGGEHIQLSLSEVI